MHLCTTPWHKAHVTAILQLITLKQTLTIQKKATQVSNINSESPTNSIIKKNETMGEKFNFTEKTTFSEFLRLDVSQLTVQQFHINSKCEILIVTDNQTIIKLNNKGEQVFEKRIQSNPGYRNFQYVKSGLIADTDEFFVNNYIVKTSNSLQELPLPKGVINKKKPLDPHIIDLAYSANNNQYIMLHGDKILTYSADGELVKSIDVKGNYYNAIIPEKEWIVVHQNEKAIVILDFDGEIVGEYGYGNGNRKYTFSSSYEYLVCHFYSVKSQFNNIKTCENETLWAHPTYIKNYKELMYHDINHNFGMVTAKFSPDCKYLIGGAEHGKYVAWVLPTLTRIELIPNMEAIDQLEPCERFDGFEGKNAIRRTAKPELVNLKGQTFLNNRRNNISRVIFIENGDFFLTEIGYGKLILTWDRNFKNTNFHKINGRIDHHSQKFLSKINKDELVLYNQE